MSFTTKSSNCFIEEGINEERLKELNEQAHFRKKLKIFGISLILLISFSVYLFT